MSAVHKLSSWCGVSPARRFALLDRSGDVTHAAGDSVHSYGTLSEGYTPIINRRCSFTDSDPSNEKGQGCKLYHTTLAFHTFGAATAQACNPIFSSVVRSVLRMTGFKFGPWQCKWGEAFYLTPLSMAIVNQKPILPGHCLVLSRRVVPRFGDLSPEEVTDLWKTAQLISGPLQTHFEGDALTFAIQDGSAAGQTVPHVHIHVLPRKNGDFPRNDQVYDELEKSDLSRAFKVDAEKERKPRSLEEMTAESKQLRRLYESPVPIPLDAPKKSHV